MMLFKALSMVFTYISVGVTFARLLGRIGSFHRYCTAAPQFVVLTHHDRWLRSPAPPCARGICIDAQSLAHLQPHKLIMHSTACTSTARLVS